MANTSIKWPVYVTTTDNGSGILIRGDVYANWSKAQQWTLDEAEDLANHLLAKVAEARRNSPEVKELTAELEEWGVFNGDSNMTIADLAQHLIRLGYRKD